MKTLKASIAKDIKNLIFDFGGVLLDIDTRRTIEAFLKLHLTGLKAEQIHPHNYGIFLAYEEGKMATDEFITCLQGYAADGPRPSAAAISDAWSAMLLEYDWRRFEMLDALRESGYNVFLLSNTNVMHRERFIEQFNRQNPFGRDFGSYFDRCFYSDEMGMRKPDEIIYRTMLKEAGIGAKESLFIDDNKPNTDAAQQIGIQTHHLISPATVLDLFE